jgi:hypothetical protein
MHYNEVSEERACVDHGDGFIGFRKRMLFMNTMGVYREKNEPYDLYCINYYFL